MYKLIRQSSYKKMSWKNGKGITYEIDVEAQEGYLWRLSMALILDSAPFSQFNNYDRFLTLWKGESIQLNDFVLKSGVIHFFSGESPIYCQKIGLQSLEIIDIGFIFKRDAIRASMKITELNCNQILNIKSTYSFIFCSKGIIEIEDIELFPGDSLKISNEHQIKLSLKSNEVQLFIIEFDLI